MAQSGTRVRYTITALSRILHASRMLHRSDRREDGMIDTTSRQRELQQLLDDQVEGSSVPGFVAGVWWDGESFEAASGRANLNTGVPMTADTAFLLGSITKVLVTSMLMRFVERGQINLDDLVVDRLPELRLGDEATVEALRVHNLVNHSSGIDASD